MGNTEPTRPDWACTDCFVLLVNGDMPGHMSEEEVNEWHARYVKGIGDTEVTPGMLAEYHECANDNGDRPEECDCETRTFSWSPCDICHSNLGGTRHAITWWVKAS